MFIKSHKLSAPYRLLINSSCVFYLLVLLIYLTFKPQFVSALENKTSVVPFSRNTLKVCNSIEVKSNLTNFKQLEGCEVVEGFVQILLFDSVNETSFSNISFPKLREITDFLLVYRIIGMRSLGKLFPNLSVIRGRKLFNGYAFIVFEMPTLEEIGLYNLTNILNGFIYIDKNPSLCFVNSIDWSLIAGEREEHFIRSNKPDNECPVCPGLNTTFVCPKTGNSNDKFLCWNAKICQKVCPSTCISCNSYNQCCNENCLGGCSNDINECSVCRYFIHENGKCAENCSINYFEHMDRRCINKNTCISLPLPLELKGKYYTGQPYKIYKNKCVTECPLNYIENYEKHICEFCTDNCPKICPGTRVDSVAAAERLKGCTHINGSLDIQIRGGKNIVNMLEENLNSIQIIDGYLKIIRSYSLLSLGFLKNLTTIKGNVLENNKFVLVVLDNQNLQELWENRFVKMRGKLFFHFNPKLCYSKIEYLKQNNTGVPDFNEGEVNSKSNGDRTACNITKLSVHIVDCKSNSVSFWWKNVTLGDSRKLIGYILYLLETPYSNISLYNSRDACGEDGWNIYDVPGYTKTGFINYTLERLRPFTHYAYYVKSYTVADEKNGTLSDISYFSTLPDVPTRPTELDVISNQSDSLYISWNPPINPNGIIDKYIVTILKLNNTEGYGRNACGESSSVPKTSSKISTPPPPVVSSKSNDTCGCGNDEQKGTTNEKETAVEIQIRFEDEIHNLVYFKSFSENKDRGRMKRSLPAINFSNLNNQSNFKSLTGKELKSFSKNTNKTEYYVYNLHHYTKYEVSVSVCRKKEENETENYYNSSSCSSNNTRIVYTLIREGADSVTNFHVANITESNVYLTWDEPKSPNGIILSYLLEYKGVDSKNSNPVTVCVMPKEFRDNNNTYALQTLNIPWGNYSVRIKVISQAGSGEYSESDYFCIQNHPTAAPLHTVAIIVISLLVILATATSAYVYWKRKKNTSKGMKLFTSVNPDYMGDKYEPDEWEVLRQNIIITEEIGQGSFGMVYKGIAKDIKGKDEIKCAIKTVNEHATNRERIEFLNEASVMKAFDTAHVVHLLGVVSQGQPTLVIMELMENGDLKSYLRSHRYDAENFTGKQPPTLKRIFQMAIEIADGMAYLSAKKFVHRDLAARNCMVAEDLTVKIGDFGMTRDIYETDYYRKGTKGLLPVRWMAPESLKDGVFTSNSDVWSYGVVLWEMATLASQPYQGLSNDQVLRYVVDGGIMERPENCPDQLYTLMRFCWQYKPTMRPTFLDIVSHLEDVAKPNFVEISFYHSSGGKEARSFNENQHEDDATTPLHVSSQFNSFSIACSGDESDIDNIDVNSLAYIHSPIKLDVDYSSFESSPRLQFSLKDNLAINGLVMDRTTTNGSANTQS